MQEIVQCFAVLFWARLPTSIVAASRMVSRRSFGASAPAACCKRWRNGEIDPTALTMLEPRACAPRRDSCAMPNAPGRFDDRYPLRRVRDGRSASAIRYERSQKLTSLEIEQPHEEVVPLHVDMRRNPAKGDAVVTRRRPSRSLQADGSEAGELFK